MSRIEQLQALLAQSPKDSFLLYALAKEFEGAGQSDAALQYFRDLLAGDPQYVGMYYHIGKLLVRLGREREALEIYDQGLSVARAQKDQHAYNELAGARLEIADDEDDF